MNRWGFAGLCALTLVICGLLAPTLVAAAHDRGRFGTFTAEDKDCVKFDCSWTGSFLSEDGAIHRDGVIYSGDGVRQSGDTVRVQWLSSDSSSVYSPHDQSWRWAVGGSTVAMTYLIWWVTRRRWRL